LSRARSICIIDPLSDSRKETYPMMASESLHPEQRDTARLRTGSSAAS
jgi:hypothetical protein